MITLSRIFYKFVSVSKLQPNSIAKFRITREAVVPDSGLPRSQDPLMQSVGYPGWSSAGEMANVFKCLLCIPQVMIKPRLKCIHRLAETIPSPNVFHLSHFSLT